MTNKVYVFKLITGEEIIGEVVGIVNDTHIRLKNVVKIVIAPGKIPGGEPQFGFVQFPTFAAPKKDAQIDISLTSIAYEYEPHPEFGSQYNQTFGSGIIVPDKKILLG